MTYRVALAISDQEEDFHPDDEDIYSEFEEEDEKETEGAPSGIVDGTRLYLKAIGAYHFLTKSEEMVLSRMVLAGDLAKRRLQNRKGITPDEKARLKTIIAEARAVAAEMGLWCGLPADRPADWNDEQHLNEDLRLSAAAGIGQNARYKLKKFTAQDRQRWERSIEQAEKLCAKYGLSWETLMAANPGPTSKPQRQNDTTETDCQFELNAQVAPIESTADSVEETDLKSIDGLTAAEWDRIDRLPKKERERLLRILSSGQDAARRIREMDQLQADVERAIDAVHALGVEWTPMKGNPEWLRMLQARKDIPDDRKAQIAELFESAADASLRLDTRPPDDDDERAKLEQDISRAKDARDVLVERNLRLVVNNAKKYMGQGLDLDDLVEWGNIGLIEAASKFDFRKGTRFSTWASMWIKQRVLRGMSDTSRNIRVPSYKIEAARRLNQKLPLLTQKLGHTPSYVEIANEMGMSESDVRHLLDIQQPTTSLDRAVSEDGGDELTYASLIPDPNVDVEGEADISELRKIFKKGFERAELTPREQTMLYQRLELDWTLDTISEYWGLTRERVRQILSDAKSRLRKVIDVRELKGYLSSDVDCELIGTRCGFAIEKEQVA
jgi:RNA polymerase primary sigma factor